MRFFSRGKVFVLVFLLLLVGGYFVGKGVFSGNTVPPEFEAARLRGALIAEAIVGLSRQSTEALAKINELDSAGKFEEAEIRAGRKMKLADCVS